MRLEDVEIHTGPVSFAYEPLRRLEAKAEAPTAFHTAPTVEAVNEQLRTMAAGIGADAVIEVAYDRGMSLTSWKAMRASGLAVRKASEDYPCPACAETIKRAATRCRFCGEMLTARTGATAAGVPASKPVDSTSQARAQVPDEPLKSSNAATGWTVVVVILAAIWMLAMMSGL